MRSSIIACLSALMPVASCLVDCSGVSMIGDMRAGDMQHGDMRGGMSVPGDVATDAPYVTIYEALFSPPTASDIPTCIGDSSCVMRCTAGASGAWSCADNTGASIAVTSGTSPTSGQTPWDVASRYSLTDVTDAKSPRLTTPASYRSWITGEHTVVGGAWSTTATAPNQTVFSDASSGAGFYARHESGLRCGWQNSSGSPTSATPTVGSTGGTYQSGFGMFACRKTGTGGSSSYLARYNTLTQTTSWGYDPASPTGTQYFGRGNSAGTPMRGSMGWIAIYSEAKSDTWIATEEARQAGTLQDGAVLTVSTATAGIWQEDADGYFAKHGTNQATINDEGILIESQRTNSWAANALDASTWTSVGTPTVTTNVSSGPFSRHALGAEADRIVDDDSGAYEGKQSASGGTTVGRWVTSCIVAVGDTGTTTDKVHLTVDTDATGSASCDLDIDSGGCAALSLSGWYRCECDATTSGTATYHRGTISVGNAASDTGSIIVSQCQIESYSTPSSPKPDNTLRGQSRVRVPETTSTTWDILDGGEIEVVFSLGYSLPEDRDGNSQSFFPVDVASSGDGDHAIVMWYQGAASLRVATRNSATSDLYETDTYTDGEIAFSRGVLYVMRFRWEPDQANPGRVCHSIYLDICDDDGTACTATTEQSYDEIQGRCDKYQPQALGPAHLGERYTGTFPLDGRIRRFTVRDAP